MTPEYEAFIAAGRRLALDAGLDWNFPYDSDGAVPARHAWNLSELRKSIERPITRLGLVSVYRPAVEVLRSLDGERYANLQPTAMTAPWVDLYRSIVLHDQLIKRNKPANAVTNVGQAFRILAAAAFDMHPAELNAADVRLAFNAALQTGASGKRGGTLRGIISQWVDTYRLSVNVPLTPHCEPFADDLSQSQFTKLREQHQRQAEAGRRETLRSELSQRQRAERLPDERSFWELARIIFAEKPRSFSDAVRFNQYKLLLLTGMRVTELATLPADTLVRVQHLDFAGRDPRAGGGVAETIRLRHFAEKQANGEVGSGVALVEAFQHVPEIFRPFVEEAVQSTLALTAPLRETLKLQLESGRLFPDLSPHDHIPAAIMYGRLSGMIQFSSRAPRRELEAAYRADFSFEALDQIHREQVRALANGVPSKNVSDYFTRAERKFGRPIALSAFGGGGERGGSAYVRVSDAEAFARACLPSKLPDHRSALLADGTTITAPEFLFLYPGRALAEAKHDALVDVRRYFSVQRVSAQDIQRYLGRELFERYSDSSEEPFEGINPHALRHLLTTELFKHELPDAIISKHFNRTSVAQSYSYDHRSLSEHLDAVDQPSPAAAALEPKARQAWDLIRQGRVSGPLQQEFLQVQLEHGDEAAFAFLNAEARALHATPYGFCLNSFATNPCPKHLECFNGCGHLLRGNDPREQQNLSNLRDRLAMQVERLKVTPRRGPRYPHHLEHTQARLEGVTRALDAAPGGQVSPGGEDLHIAFARSAEAMF